MASFAPVSKPTPLNLDAASMDALALSVFLRGWQAARSGSPFDATQSPEWRDGFAFFAHMQQ